MIFLAHIEGPGQIETQEEVLHSFQCCTFGFPVSIPMNKIEFHSFNIKKNANENLKDFC